MKLFITGASGYIGGSFLTKALEYDKVAKKKLPTKIAPRRISDLPVSNANAIKSNKILKWQTKKHWKGCVEVT